MSQWLDERRDLIRALRDIGGAGRAEGERPDQMPLGFYPVPEHLRLLDPDVVLVVGPRGAGKTEIARVLTEMSLYDAVARQAPKVRLPTGSSRWLGAHPGGRDGFEAIGLRQVMVARGDNTDVQREIWFAYLLRTLTPVLDDSDRAALSSVLSPAGAEIDSVLKAFHDLGTTPVVVLDRLDQRLETDDRYVFVTYDELDTLGDGDWKLIESGVRGLVAFWAAYARRWRRIRAKLFLRTDLYERHARAGGADLAKLAAGRVDLVWNERDLCGVLLKRLANLDPGLGKYTRAVKGIDWTKDATLGAIPKLRTWRDARPVIERMVGEHMGANKQKGLVFRWVVDHVRDGLGRVSPRPFVRLFEEAARQELDQMKPLPGQRLITPASLRRALDRVSEDHVFQSRQEWPWLDAVKDRFKTHLVPWEREKDLLALLEGVGAEPAGKFPPFDGRDLVEYLIVLGILRRRPDDRIDAPDLYCAGLGLRRKGGVRKRVERRR